MKFRDPKLLTMLNKWGKFYSRETNTYFSSIEFPRSKDKVQIINAYEMKCKGITKESEALTKENLNKIKDVMREEHWNWLYLALWFGLRPKEVDNLLLKEGEFYEIKKYKGKEYIAVEQTKLSGVVKSKRIKNIPVIFDEQRFALKIIENKNFKRPLVKTIKSYLGDAYNTYCGRKGFEALLLDMSDAGKVTYHQISSWLGHSSVDRTWKNYRNRDRVDFGEVG
jgi:hypothetical protein